MKKNNQKGISLLITLLIMTAILSITIGIANLSIGEIQLSRESPYSLVAFYAAESGVEWAMFQDRANGMASQSYGNPPNPPISYCLDSYNNICYKVSASGASPSRTITSDGSYKTTVRSVESIY